MNAQPAKSSTASAAAISFSFFMRSFTDEGFTSAILRTVSSRWSFAKSEPSPISPTAASALLPVPVLSIRSAISFIECLRLKKSTAKLMTNAMPAAAQHAPNSIATFENSDTTNSAAPHAAPAISAMSAALPALSAFSLRPNGRKSSRSLP